MDKVWCLYYFKCEGKLGWDGVRFTLLWEFVYDNFLLHEHRSHEQGEGELGKSPSSVTRLNKHVFMHKDVFFVCVGDKY